MTIRPKLLFLVTEDWYFWSHRLPIARAAHNAGYEVVVATRVQEHGDRILAEGFGLVPLRLSRGSYSPWHELMAIRELRRLYRAEKPDIVHHVAMKPVLYGAIAVLGLRDIQVVNAFAGLGYLAASSSLKAWLLRLVILTVLRFLLWQPNHRVLLQNKEDQEFIINKLKVGRDRTILIRGSGVDVRKFTATPEPAGGVPLVVLSSRMLWNKGIEEFVEAAQTLRSEGIATRFILAGNSDEGSPSSIPRETLLRWKESGSVEWWGHQDNVVELLQRATLVCLPSHGGEGVPKSLLEAAASQRTIVTTDVPGCRDIVRQNVNGLLVPPKDVTALAEAIKELLIDSTRRKEMAERGRDIAVREFAEEVVIQQTLAFYQQILPGTRCGPGLGPQDMQETHITTSSSETL